MPSSLPNPLHAKEGMLAIWHRSSLVVIGIGVLLRLSVLVMSDDPANSGPDAPSYVKSAAALIDLGFLADTQQLRVFPWGYAFALAVVSYPFSLEVGVILFLVLQLALFAIAILFLTDQIARMFNPKIALISAIYICLAPLAIDAGASIMYENILISLNAMWLASIIAISGGHVQLHWKLILGASSTAVLFIHPRLLPLTILTFLLLAIFLRRFVLASGVLAVNSVGIFVLYLRNYLSQGDWYISANQGGNLVIGLPLTGFNYCSSEFYEPPGYAVANPAGDSALGRCALEWIASNPLEWLSSAPSKVMEYAGLFPTRGIGRTVSTEPLETTMQYNAAGGMWFVLTLQLIGLFVLASVLIWTTVSVLVGNGAETRSDRLVLAFAFLAVITGIVLALIFYGYPRFRLPYAPFFALLFGFSVFQFATWLPQWIRRVHSVEHRE